MASQVKSGANALQKSTAITVLERRCTYTLQVGGVAPGLGLWSLIFQVVILVVTSYSPRIYFTEL